MSEKINVHDYEQYNAIQKLIVELDWGTDPEAIDLKVRLKKRLKRIRGPRTLIIEITAATDAIRDHKIAFNKLNEYICKKDRHHSVKGLYTPMAGGGSGIRPGVLLYCPVEGCQYRQFMIEKGEEIYCLYHPDKLLVSRQKIRRKK